ncbi:MAG: SPFH domain-containing protein [Candidatus Hydrogenedentota bacterium]
METGLYITGGIALLAVLFFSLILLLSKRYKRCPSNRILVIYGKVNKGQSAKTIHGGAAFVIPLLQDFDYLSLEPIQIEVPLRDALSMENIRVSVPSVFTVAIGTEPDMMNNAAIRLLGLDIASIQKQCEDIIFGQLRQVIASMKIQDINRDREQFLINIQTNLEPELRKVGMVLINVNITDITDESGYIEAIGKKAASEAIQRARGDVADEQKKGEIRVAEAERDEAVQVAEHNKLKQIGMREAQREQAVRIADLAKEQAVGEQQAAFLQETKIKDAEREKRVAVANADSVASIGEKEAEQSMRVSVAEADARAIEGENTSQAAVAVSNASLEVQRAESYQIGQTKTEEAKAAVMEAKNLALAKAAIADAQRVEAEHRARLEATAKAKKAETIVEAQAEAERMRLEAEGEASAIFAKLEAEAKGQYEILAKKGDGLRQIVDACGGADQAFKLLMLEQLEMLAETSAKAISNIKFDKVIVWENGGSDGKGSTSGFLSSLANTMPPMLQVMKDIGGIEFPDALATIHGDDETAKDDEQEARKPEDKAKDSPATEIVE